MSTSLQPDLAESADNWFESAVPSPFMILSFRVRDGARERLAGVTHADGTARVQTVHADTNPLFHLLIQRVADMTGIPVVLNTSFNLRGEPIVNSPADALSTFRRSDIDALCIANFVVEKNIDPGGER